MTARSIAPWVAAAIALCIAVAYALLVRLPLPFPGFAAVVAGLLAFLLTIAMVAAMPPRWMYSDAELLRHAFRSRHKVSDGRADMALVTLASTHDRASRIRSAAKSFIPDLKARAERAADRLDDAARELYYDPNRLDALRSPMVRAELVEEAVLGHATLKARDGAKDVAQSSREKLGAALDALEEAFAAADAATEARLLAQVEASSATAEALLARSTPRH